MDSRTRLGSNALLGGVFVALLIVLLALYQLQHRQDGPSDQFTLIMQKETVLSRMRANLLKAVEAEKSAVLADSDQVSRTIAEQARALSQTVERDRQEMHRLEGLDTRQDEAKYLAEFDAAWGEFQKVDKEILELATYNTNRRAADLSRTEATQHLDNFEEALAGLTRAHAGKSGTAMMNLLAGQAVASALHILVLQSPHIAAAEDADMDKIETEMASRAAQVAQDLEQLRRLAGPGGQNDLIQAQSSFAAFMKTNAEITRLSRLNNSIRSIELSLGRKRNVAALCDETLAVLQGLVQAQSFKATR